MNQPARATAPVAALDIGGVCLSLHHDRCAALLGYDSLDALKQAHPAIMRAAVALETGRIDRDEFFTRLELSCGFPRPKMEEAWRLILGEEIPGIADLVRDLAGAGLKPVFLSDVSELHYAELLPRLSFTGHITGAVLSFRVGSMKPGDGMFAAMETEYCDGGVPALYLDDRLPNVEAARKRGWNSVLFDTPEATRQRLGDIL